jgi:pyruvate kinase
LSSKITDNFDHQEQSEVEDVLRELLEIREEIIAESTRMQHRLAVVHANYRESARNLLHYLVLRRRDLRPLQHRLAALGLSSLGRAEAHVLATVDAVLNALHRLAGVNRQPPDDAPINFTDGPRLLRQHTDALLGVAQLGHGVRIMVTMPSEAGHDYTLVYNLLKQGMDCMRINCAHDDPTTWLRMIEHLRRAEQSLGHSCQVVMDLAGPKLRTGPLEPGPAVIVVHPRRDVFGRITSPARIWFTAEEHPHAPPAPADACLPVPANWLQHIGKGERIKLTDASESQRVFTVVDVTNHGCWAEVNKTTFLSPGTTLRRDSSVAECEDRCANIGNLPTKENPIVLHVGDLLIVTREQRLGHSAITDSGGHILTPATIGCTIPEVFDDVRSGEAIWFDDGKIGGVVEKVETDQILVRITQARMQGEKLRADKGINLPDSSLHLSALTSQDLEDLSFVAAHADVVELSFANRAPDVELLQQHLERLGNPSLAIVLKIETRCGFENLPEMLLSAMRSPCCGVMIARGDLAVECGFERLAEVQEEILWICEAAHVPVIWATQVLESLAKQGMPSRAEITDAAMGHRAECVMLNKGPHVVTAVRVLDDILLRMQSHQTKKQAMLRELRLAHTLQVE